MIYLSHQRPDDSRVPVYAPFIISDQGDTNNTEKESFCLFSREGNPIFSSVSAYFNLNESIST